MLYSYTLIYQQNHVISWLESVRTDDENTIFTKMDKSIFSLKHFTGDCVSVRREPSTMEQVTNTPTKQKATN